MTIEQPGSQKRHRIKKLPNEGMAEVWLQEDGPNVVMHTESRNSTSSSGGTTNWKKCAVEGCLGEAILQSKCLEHANAASRTEYLHAIYNSREVLLLRGVAVSQELSCTSKQFRSQV